MQSVVEDSQALQGEGPSVWPSYVAAVASVVLCILLLISVLSLVVGRYAEVVRDGGLKDQGLSLQVTRSLEVGDLLEGGRVEEVGVGESSKSRVEHVVREYESENYLLEQRLKFLREARSGEGSDLPLKSEEVRFDAGVQYLFVFEGGAFDLDLASIETLRKLVEDRRRVDGVTWFIEVGVAGLSDVAVREVYGLSNRIRGKLMDLGVSSREIRLHLNRGLTQEAMAGGGRAQSLDLMISLRVKNDIVKR